MSESVTTRELIERLVRESGMKKKLATEILHAIPEVIEEGLIRDGEVRVKGLGTFRMKWTQGRIGRNPVTGEDIDLPAHYRLVFIPEQSLKEFINKENEMLGYAVIEEEVVSRQSSVVSRQSSVSSQQLAVDSNDLENEEDEMDYHYVPEEPVRRRRIHWVIPVAIIVIAALSVVFYFRNFNSSNQQSAVSSQQEEVVGRQSSVVSQQSAVGSQEVADTVKVDPEPEKLQTQNPITPTQDSGLRTQDSQGKHLFQLARETYGNPFLWVLIYKANIDKVPNPDVVIAGKELVIPELEGKPHQLSHNDSVNVAEGYRLVYEYYKDKENPKAEDFHSAYLNYLPR